MGRIHTQRRWLIERLPKDKNPDIVSSFSTTVQASVRTNSVSKNKRAPDGRVIEVDITRQGKGILFSGLERTFSMM